MSLIHGFVPGLENTFSVLSAAGNITGEFSNIASGQRLNTTDGLGSFLVHYGTGSAFNPRQIVLTNFQRNIPEPTALTLFCAILFAGAFTRVRAQ